MRSGGPTIDLHHLTLTSIHFSPRASILSRGERERERNRPRGSGGGAFMEKDFLGMGGGELARRADIGTFTVSSFLV